MSIVIKKKVSLDFLGEYYANSYLVFKSISTDEYPDLQDEVKKVPEGKFMEHIKNVLKSRLLEGKIDQDGGQVEVTKDNFGELDPEVMFVSYKAITGQLDPKV